MQIRNSKLFGNFGVAAVALLVGFAISGCRSPQVATVAPTPVPAEIEVAPAPVIESVPLIPVATATRAPRRAAMSPRIAAARVAPEPPLSEIFPVQPTRDRPARRAQRPNNESRPSPPSRDAPERATQAPISGGQVWVNTNSDVYHMPGMRYYGKTRSGYYTSEAQAQAAGYRRATR